MWRTRGTTSRSPGRGRAAGALPVRRGARPATCAGDGPSARCRFGGAGTAAPGADCGDCRRRHRARPPTRVVGMNARYIPLVVSTTPSRCRRPPRGADGAHPRSRPGNARTRATAVPRPLPPVGYARKGAELRNTCLPQGLDSGLVRGAVLPNSSPCARRQEGTRGGAAGKPAGQNGGPAPTRVLGARTGEGRVLRPKGARVTVLEAPRGGPPSSARCRCPQCAPEGRRMGPRPPQPPLSARRRPRPGRSAPPRRRRPA